MSTYKFKKETVGFSIEQDGVKGSYSPNAVCYVSSANADVFQVYVSDPRLTLVINKTKHTVFINDANVTANTTAQITDSLRDEVFPDANSGNGSPGKWVGKNVLVLADSYFADNYLTTKLQTELGCTLINKSVGNTTVTPGYKTIGQSYWDRVQTANYFTSNGIPHLILIWGSVNEAFGGSGGTPVPLGSLADAETGNPTTFYGALKQVINKAVTAVPTAKVVVSSPVQILQTASRGTYTTQRSYRNATLDVAKSKKIPFLDLFHESGLYPEVNNIWLASDQVHPTDAGGDLIVSKTAKFLNQL